MQLSLGFSPCPNDTFMMDALVNGKIRNPEINFDVVIEDVESLNSRALRASLDVSKVSFHTYLKIRETYTLLPAGAALGFGCGPLIISRTPVSNNDLVRGPVALPGELTTAHLLFRLRHPAATNKVYVVFSEIEDMVTRGDAVAGVIIHENRFTYAQKGLRLVEDLGTFWELETGGPIPLGAFVARSSLGPRMLALLGNKVRSSIQMAIDNPDGAQPYVRRHAQEMRDEVMRQHIDTYVNGFSIDLGSEGRHAISQLEKRAARAGIVG